MSKIIESGLWLLRSIAVCLFWADIASFESSWVAVECVRVFLCLSCLPAFLFCLVYPLCLWAPQDLPHEPKSVEAARPPKNEGRSTDLPAARNFGPKVYRNDKENIRK
jgi:hypothetical protein